MNPIGTGKLERYKVGDVVRMANYPTSTGFRCWKIIGEYLGGEKQEGSYELLPLEVHGNRTINVPCIMLETHQGIVRV